MFSISDHWDDQRKVSMSWLLPFHSAYIGCHTAKYGDEWMQDSSEKKEKRENTHTHTALRWLMRENANESFWFDFTPDGQPAIEQIERAKFIFRKDDWKIASASTQLILLLDEKSNMIEIKAKNNIRIQCETCRNTCEVRERKGGKE